MTQFKRLAAPVLASPSASRLNGIDVEDLYSVYEARAELDALLPEIEAVLERVDDDGNLQILDGSIILAERRLVEQAFHGPLRRPSFDLGLGFFRAAVFFAPKIGKQIREGLE